MKKLLAVIFLFVGLFTKAQNVYIPDVNFKAALLANTAINTNGDTAIQVAEANAFTGFLNLYNLGIHDLTGIGAFTQLDSLDCNHNQLDSLDLSTNTAITYLNCSINYLSTLDLTANTAITFLDCFANNLTTLDLSTNTAITTLHCNNNYLTSLDLSANTAITFLECSATHLTTLDLSANTAITSLYCYHNPLTSLDLSTNTAINTLYCYNNQLTSLDLSTNTAITTLYCYNNQLTSLDLSTNTAINLLICYNNHLTNLDLSANTAILELNCSANQLTSLDLSANTAITNLDCSFNQSLTSLDLSANIDITYLNCYFCQLGSLDLSANTAINTLFCDFNNLSNLNLKNGNNIGLSAFRANHNPNLACIEVDNINYMNSHFGNNIDTFTVFATHCAGIEPIMGNIYRDLNSNCYYDSTDIPIGNGHLKLYDNTNTLVQQVYSKASGFYKFNVQGGVYNVVLDTIGTPYTFQCAQPGIDTALSTSFTDSTNFDVICKSGFDLNVHSITNTGWVFPGQQHNLKINAGDAAQWNNFNCSSGIGGTVMITIAGPITYVGPAAGALVPVVSGNTLTYIIADFGTITNSSAFAVLLNTNTNAVVGDSVCVTANITASSGTETKISNNTMHLCYAVRNSFDPNTKETYPETVLPGYSDYFTYIVNFQNTGSAQAFNIKVVDTLAANLDMNTFELLSYSHACEVSIAGNILTANFENINLADSTTNEAASHGYFQYRIKPLPNQPNGTHIKNTAHIFFDFNPAVATNTTINSFQLPNYINEMQENEVSIYPNPGNGLFTVSSKSVKDASIKISNVLGKVVYQMQLQKNNAALIDFSLQPKGVYILKLEEEGKGFLNKKIVIQ